MAVGVLGQAAGAAATEVRVFTAPPGITTSVTAIFVCNRGAATTFRLRITFAGAHTAENRQYLYFDTALRANDTLVIPYSIAMSDGQTIYGRGASANVNFVVMGKTS